MKERGILFSASMVRAILAGTKTQTRRVCKPATADSIRWAMGGDDERPAISFFEGGWNGPAWYVHSEEYPEEGSLSFACPYGQPGDRLWVRETWAPFDSFNENMAPPEARACYRADHSFAIEPTRWKPSIFMPRWASRITLEVTDIRVERLQDISEADAWAEGVESTNLPDPYVDSFGLTTPGRAGYAQLWESINGPESWDANPWVWCISFKSVAAQERAA